MPSTASVKKSWASHQSMQSSRCQVEGCNIDLTTAKYYHRKHRVCESHSKCPRVIVAGQERRFCQQCSRFHGLSEFDQKKRSCRRRLSDHNARRRKPQLDTISFSSSRLSSPFYDDRQQMNFLLSRAPFGQMRPTTSSTWEGSFDFKLMQMKGSWKKTKKAGDIDEQLHLPSIEPSNVVSTLGHEVDRFLPFKSTIPQVPNQGPEASVIASNLDGAPYLRSALSLLSTTDSWCSADPGPASSLAHLANSNQTSIGRLVMHAGGPTSEYLQGHPPLAQQEQILPFSMQSNGSPSQEFQLFREPYENTFFDSNQIQRCPKIRLPHSGA